MPAPTLQHERRREFLRTIATLAGYTVDCSLDDECRPDVVRVDMLRARILIGEAKDTETPSCPATRQRLLRYAKAAASWTEIGFAVKFAICHGRQLESECWLALLRDVVQGDGTLLPRSAGSALFDEATTLTWVEVAA